MEIGEVDLKWLGHSGFLIQNSKVIYIDPYQIKDGLIPADVILITHGHYDHCSFSDLQKIVKPGTVILCTPDSQSKIMKFECPIELIIVHDGDELDLGTLKVMGVPAYNIDKSFHTKDQGLLGYVLKINNLILYHAGDTDVIPEMQRLTGFNQSGKTFVALLPVGGRYTMDAHEAFEACKMIKPTIAIPMHYGSVVGSLEDAEEFKELCLEENLCRVELLEKF